MGFKLNSASKWLPVRLAALVTWLAIAPSPTMLFAGQKLDKPRIKKQPIKSVEIEDPLIRSIIEDVQLHPAPQCMAGTPGTVESWKRGAEYAMRIDTIIPEIGPLNRLVGRRIGLGYFDFWNKKYSLEVVNKNLQPGTLVAGAEKLSVNQRQKLEKLQTRYINRLACGEFPTDSMQLACCKAAMKRIAKRISRAAKNTQAQCQEHEHPTLVASMAYGTTKAREHCRNQSTLHDTGLKDDEATTQCFLESGSRVRFTTNWAFIQDFQKTLEFNNYRVNYALGDAGIQAFQAKELDDPEFKFETKTACQTAMAAKTREAETRENEKIAATPEFPIAMYAGYSEIANNCQEFSIVAELAPRSATDHNFKSTELSPSTPVKAADTGSQSGSAR